MTGITAACSMQHLSHKTNSFLTIAQSQLIVSQCYISVYWGYKITYVCLVPRERPWKQ